MSEKKSSEKTTNSTKAANENQKTTVRPSTEKRSFSEYIKSYIQLPAGEGRPPMPESIRLIIEAQGNQSSVQDNNTPSNSAVNSQTTETAESNNVDKKN